jgi:hypothetical protein
VALGSPEDYLPPEGALRTYADDTTWKDLFYRFAQQSACIVTEIGRSANLRWEFTQIRNKGLQEKLFVLTPCSQAGYRFHWTVLNLFWFLKGLYPVRWREFSRDLSELGYEVSFGNPGPGSVIMFDADGRGMVLTSRARQPSEFIEPIAAWVGAREKTGRHVRVSCSLCGEALYLSSTEAGIAGKPWCEVCESTSQPGARLRRILTQIVICVYWAYMLLSPSALMAIFAIFIPGAGWRGRLLGGAVGGLLLLTIAMHVWVVHRAWDGLPRDDKKTANWYRHAADAGDTNAMVNLGIMYRRGWGGLPRDDVQAASLYRRAAEAGNASGMNNLGFLYENGMGGLPKSDAEAIKWCAKAASLGDTHAQESLKRLRSVVSKSDNLAERAGQYPPIVVAKAKSGDVDRC